MSSEEQQIAFSTSKEMFKENTDKAFKWPTFKGSMRTHTSNS